MRSVIINGIQAEHLSVMDRGFQYGDGLFETIVYENGALQFWDSHISRMHKGANKLGLLFPGSDKYLDDIQQLLKDTTYDKRVIKLLLTRGQGERGYRRPPSSLPTRVVMSTHYPDYSPELVSKGIDVCLCDHPVSINSSLAGIKHLNRLDNVLARSEWNDEFHEGFMLDANDYLIEGTMSNIFCIKNKTLYTPDLEQCGINGIIREQVLSIAKKNDLEYHIANITVDELYTMEEVFITNSVIGLWPVRRVGETSYPTGGMTIMFSNELRQRIKENETAIT